MKKIVTLLFIFIFFGLMLTGKPAMADQTITLKFTSYIPPPPAFEAKLMLTERFMDVVTKRSRGRVKWKTFWAGTLGPAPDQYELVERGVADVTMCSPAYEHGVSPLTAVAELPFSGPNNIVVSEIRNEMFREGWLDREWTKVHPLCFYSSDSWSIISRKKISKVDDLRGLKIRARSVPMVRFLELWGATPIQIPAGDIYMGLETGVLDGALFPQSLMSVFKFYEVGKYNLDIEAFLSSDAIYMNNDTWNKLPKDIQAIFNDIMESTAEKCNLIWQKRHKDFEENAQKYGVQHSVISSTAKNYMRKESKKIWERYIADEEARGNPARAYAKAWRAKLIKRGLPSPF